MMSQWLPPIASAHGAQIDAALDWVHWLMAVLFVGWISFFLFALWRFRCSRNPVASYSGAQSHASSWLEGAVALAEAVLLIGLAAAAHQGFSANLFTLTSDTFPAQAVGSVVGMGGMAGSLGGMLIATIVGHTLQWTGSYMVPFLMAGCAYLLALAAIQLLVPRLEPANLR